MNNIIKQFDGFDVEKLKGQALYIESEEYTGNCLVVSVTPVELKLSSFLKGSGSLIITYEPDQVLNNAVSIRVLK